MSRAKSEPASELRVQAQGLRLHGLLARWSEVMAQPEQARWITQWLAWEAAERGRRSLERRLRDAHIGRFKPLADFDWGWPKQCDRMAIEELMTLQFMANDRLAAALDARAGAGGVRVPAGHARSSMGPLRPAGAAGLA